MRTAAFALALFGNLLYHWAQRSTPRDINPFLSLMLTYVVALTLCVVAFLSSKPSQAAWPPWRHMSWASLACGVAIFCVEAGVLLAYRSGWRLKDLALTLNVTTAFVLLPMGILLLREKASWEGGCGFLLCVAGLALLLR